MANAHVAFTDQRGVEERRDVKNFVQAQGRVDAFVFFASAAGDRGNLSQSVCCHPANMAGSASLSHTHTPTHARSHAHILSGQVV